MVIKVFGHLKKGGTCNIIFEKKIIPPMPFRANEKFQLPSDGGGVLDCD
jgi:hypothetical protein